MNKHLLLLIFVFLSLNLSAQSTFDKGYFIDESNNKVECFIKNNDWINAPNEIEYQLLENGQVETRDFNRMSSFQIYNTSQYYIKSVVEIDERFEIEGFKPELKTVVLKVLLEAEASLYSFSTIFFYKVNEGKIKQLIYKKYVNAVSQLKEDNSFRRELYENLKCDNNIVDLRKLPYEEEKLIPFFKNYNSCQDSNYTSFADDKKKSIKRFSLLAGVTQYKGEFPISEAASVAPSVGTVTKRELKPSDSSTSFLVGFEGELVLPYQNYSWSIFTAPTFQKISFDAVQEKVKPKSFDMGYGTLYLDYDYSYLNIPIGVRRYFYLNEKSKLYLDAALSLIVFTEKSEISNFKDISGEFLVLDNSNKSDTPTAISSRIGFGYKYNDKYALSINYVPKSNLSQSDVDGFALIASYKLF